MIKKNSKIDCFKNLLELYQWNTKKYILKKTLTTGKSATAFIGSGAYVYIIENRKTKKEYILKFFNKKDTRNLREIYILCRISGIKGVPKLEEYGITTLPKKYGENLGTNKLFYICSFVKGEAISDMNIIFEKKRDVLYISLEILKILQRIRERVGDDFEHYDLHVGNIIIDKKKSPPGVSIIDFDLADSKQLSFLPEETKWNSLKKGHIGGIIDEKISPSNFKFLWKWYRGIAKISDIVFKNKRISNTDIWNWFIISSVLFDKNELTEKIVSCKDIDDCLKKNFSSLRK